LSLRKEVAPYAVTFLSFPLGCPKVHLLSFPSRLWFQIFHLFIGQSLLEGASDIYVDFSVISPPPIPRGNNKEYFPPSLWGNCSFRDKFFPFLPSRPVTLYLDNVSHPSFFFQHVVSQCGDSPFFLTFPTESARPPKR